MAHRYIIGNSGSGKSTLLKQFMLEQIQHGLFFIDPHGHDADDFIQLIPETERGRILLFDPSDSEFPIPWNPLTDIEEDERAFVASVLVDSIKDAWGYSNVSTPTMDQYLFNTTYALIEANQPLTGMKFMLTSPRYRKRVLRKVTDPIIKDFWDDFETLPEKDKRDTTRSTLNKIGAILSDSRIRNSIGQSKTRLVFKDIVNSNVILIARLPQGQLGIGKVKLIGSLLLTQFHLAALSRETSEPFNVYIDEVHNFFGATLTEMLSGIRKFNVDITLVHQYLDQLTPKQQAAILGNVSTKILFRVSGGDAKKLNDLVGTNNLLSDLNVLPPHNARIVTDGKIEEHYLEDLLPERDPDALAEVIARNRRNYARPREKVEAYIRRFIEKT